jgi:hypothetical protein
MDNKTSDGSERLHRLLQAQASALDIEDLLDSLPASGYFGQQN